VSDALNPDIDGVGFDASDKWTKMLREREFSEKPKVRLSHRKRNPFEMFGYNPNHLPHQGSYEQIRKKKLDAWENPKFDWPPKICRPTMHTGKTLLNLLDKEEKERVKSTRKWEVPDFRTGDVVKFSVLQSVSEGKAKEFSGIVFGKSAPNSIRGKCWINFSKENVNI